MADFTSLIERIVVGLDEPTAENRDAVYALVRRTLARQLDGSGTAATNEAAALDDAIARVEAKFSGAAISTSAAETALYEKGHLSVAAMPALAPPAPRSIEWQAVRLQCRLHRARSASSRRFCNSRCCP